MDIETFNKAKYLRDKIFNLESKIEELKKLNAEHQVEDLPNEEVKKLLGYAYELTDECRMKFVKEFESL